MRGEGIRARGPWRAAGWALCLLVLAPTGFPGAASAAVQAGDRVVLREAVEGDLFAAGGEVEVGAEVSDDLFAAGGRVSLLPGAVVGGSAWLTGGDVDVAGHVRGDVRAAAGRIRIGAQVEGDVHLAGATIEILPGARIAGRVTYRSPHPAQIAPGARVDGGVTHRAVGVRESVGRVARIVVWALGLTVLLALVVVGTLLLVIFPDATRAAARTVIADPARSVLVGLLVVVATPLAVAVLVLTLLGIPLGALTAGVYLIWLMVGFLTALICLGDLGLGLVSRSASRGLRLLFFLLALLLVAVAQTVPFLGAAVLVAAVVLGTGGWTLHLVHRHRAVTAVP